jgi:hypothetical protein
MKDGNWIPVDKRIVNLLPKGGEYTFLEAYISLRIDLDNGADISINGYARLWSWSRNKVRHFVEGLRTGKGHSVDTQRTGKGQELRLIFNTLEEQKDIQGTAKGQAKDRQGTTTINTNTKKNKTSAPRKESNTPFHRFCSWWCYAYQKALGQPYHMTGKDRTLISDLIKTYNNGQFPKLIVAGCHILTTDDPWIEDKRTIGILHTKVNEMMAKGYGEYLEDWREIGIVPPEGVKFDDWQFKTTED